MLPLFQPVLAILPVAANSHSQMVGLAILLGYFGLILLLARVFSMKIRDLGDYFLAGRKLGAWPVAWTFAASWFGAGSIIATLNAFYKDGLSSLWLLPIPSFLSTLCITLFMSRRVADQPYLSQPEAVEARYGRTARLLLSLVLLAAITTFLGAQLVAAGQICQALLGMDIITATLLVSLAVVSYATLGGYFAVVVTDMGQMAFVILGLVILLIAGGSQLNELPVWLHQMQAIRPQPHFWQLQNNLWENACLTTSFVLAWVIAPEMWQRMTSTRNRDIAFQSALRASLILMALFVMVILIGVFSLTTVTALPGENPEQLNVLVALARQLPHPALTALVLAGVMAAITSTMDSSLNVGSLTLTNDLYQGFLRPKASMKELLWVSRLSTLLMALPAVAIALKFQDIPHVLWMSADIYATTLFVPVVAMLYLKRPAKSAGLAAMLAGAVMATINGLVQYQLVTLPQLDLFGVMLQWPKAPYATLLGVAISVLVFVFTTLWEQQQQEKGDFVSCLAD